MIGSRLYPVCALAVALSVAAPASLYAACGEECDSEYASEIDNCKIQFGDDPADAADLANCIQEARDSYRSCLDNCSSDVSPVLAPHSPAALLAHLRQDVLVGHHTPPRE